MAVADHLADRLLSRDVDLARLEASEQRAILALLRQLRRDLKTRLAAINPTDPQRPSFQVQRLTKLQTEADAAIRATQRAIRRRQTGTLERVATLEATTLAAELNATAGVDLFSPALDVARLQALMDDVVVEGISLRDWWSKQDRSLREGFRAAMRRGQLSGDGLQALMGRIDALMRVGERQAETLVRSSLISTQNHARNLLFEHNDDVVDALVWYTAMDSRVCLTCQGLSQLRFAVKDKQPVGHSKRWPGVVAHPACRCTQVPQVKSFEELMRL